MEIGDCVYILTGQVVNEYKIGKTNNIFHRLATFRTASPEIRVRHLCYTPNKDFVEKNMHELYKKFVISQNHEWFKIGSVEPVIKKLENIAKDFLSENQELTFNETLKRHWYRELKFVAKSEGEKNIVVGKYDFKTERIAPLDRSDLLLCFRFGMTYEELEAEEAEEGEEEVLSEFVNLNIRSAKRAKADPSCADFKDPLKAKSEPKIKAYCKSILTKGLKKGEVCGRLVTAKPINLCQSHANLKRICRFLYTRGEKKDTMCAIKIKEGEYCTPHQYVIRKREEKKEGGEIPGEDDNEEEDPDFIPEEGEGEEEEEEEYEDCEDEAGEEEGSAPNESVQNFKSVQENLMFLYKDLCTLGFIRPCSRCKTFYTKNYFVKKGRVCHFCKTDWY